MKQVILSFNNNYIATEDGYIINRKTDHIIKPILKNGYAEVRLSDNGTMKSYRLHRIIFKSFRDLPAGYHVNHINGIRNDNKLLNLEAVTPQENNNKRIFLNRGEKVNTAKLTPDQVMEIRKAKQQGISTKKLMAIYKMSKTSINRIASGKNWKHLQILPNDKTIWGDPRKTGAMARATVEERYGKDYWSKIATGNKFKKHCSTCKCSEN